MLGLPYESSLKLIFQGDPWYNKCMKKMAVLTAFFSMALFLSAPESSVAFGDGMLFNPKQTKKVPKRKESLAERTLKKSEQQKKQEELREQLEQKPKEKKETLTEQDKKAIEQLRDIAKEWIVMANQKYPEVVKTDKGYIKHYTIYSPQCDVEIQKTYRDDAPYLGFVIIPNTYYATRAHFIETEAWEDSLFMVHNRVNRVVFEYAQDWVLSPLEQKLVFNQRWEFKKVQYREEESPLGSPNF